MAQQLIIQTGGASGYSTAFHRWWEGKERSASRLSSSFLSLFKSFYFWTDLSSGSPLTRPARGRKVFTDFYRRVCWDGFCLPESEVINGISVTSSPPEDSRTVSCRSSGGWMDNMSPQQQQDSLSRGGGQQDNKRVWHFWQCCESLSVLMDSSAFNCNGKQASLCLLNLLRAKFVSRSYRLSNGKVFFLGSLFTFAFNFPTKWEKAFSSAWMSVLWIDGRESSSGVKTFTRVTPRLHEDAQTTEGAGKL